MAELRYEDIKKRIDGLIGSEIVKTLTGTNAHHINNIITTIMGYAEVIKAKTEDQDTIKKTNIILKQSERAKDLTQGLVYLSGGGGYNPIDLDVNTLIRKVSGENIKENITLGYDLEDNIMAINTDENQITHALTNMIRNAGDAMPDGGKLTFKTENKYIDESYKKEHPEIDIGDYVKISITDTGTGIAEDIINKIFDPSFSTKTDFKGEDMGLSAVYGIIKSNKGRIDVHSEPGKTTFEIYLPAVKKNKT